MEKKQAATQIFQDQEAMMAEEEMMVQEPYQAGAGGDVLGQNEIDGLLAAAAPEAPAPGIPNAPVPVKSKRKIHFPTLKTSEEMQLDKEPIQIQETGSWFWRRIIVPPNAYVVHTRINRKKPITLGMGVSFKYKKKTDSYLVVPAALQTIGVVANCISKEKQGINVLAYVQWQINDFSIAYRNLDFSDKTDPLGIVNAQLREQAEAAIKDKIATMSIEEVLTDKSPVIEELTSRLREVTEGRTSESRSGELESEGLGIKITTVQIREAIISSETLWRDLQSPYRHEQNQKSRISYLESQNEIKRKELDTKRSIETEQAETDTQIEAIRQKKETEQVELRLQEEASRFEKEQTNKLQRLQLEEKAEMARKDSKQQLEKREKELDVEKRIAALQEEARIIKETHDKKLEQLGLEMEMKKQEGELYLLSQQQEAELQEIILSAKLENEKRENDARIERQEREGKLRLALEEGRIQLGRLKQEIRNLMNDRDLMGRLIKAMPDIASQLPDVDELKIIKTDDNPLEAVSMMVSQIIAVLDTLKSTVGKGKDKPEGEESG